MQTKQIGKYWKIFLFELEDPNNATMILVNNGKLIQSITASRTELEYKYKLITNTKLLEQFIIVEGVSNNPKAEYKFGKY